MGREISNSWLFLTDLELPHERASIDCKHCNANVKTHRKVVNAVNHLTKCVLFKRFCLANDLNPDFMTSGPTQPLISKAFPKPLSAKEQDQANDALGMFFFTSGTAFYRAGNRYLRNFAEQLRPDAKIPTRKDLAGKILDRNYNRLIEKMEPLLRGKGFGCLTSDGWTNVNGLPVVNYMLLVNDLDGKELLLERSLTTESHTAQWLADDAARVIHASHVPIAGIVTDNAGPNKAAWNILAREFPGLMAYGCVSHGMHLMVRDLLEEKKSLPENHVNPFASLASFTLTCRDVVKFFCNFHAPRQALKEISTAGLVLPGETRWGSYLACYQSILNAKGAIFAIATDDRFIGGAGKQYNRHRAVRGFITNPDTIPNLTKGIALLAPIDALIKKYQSNKVPVSEVYRDWFELTKTLKNLPLLSPLERVRVEAVSTDRWNFIYNDAQGVAYLLDPRFVGESMNDQDKHMTENFVAEFVKFDEKNVVVQLSPQEFDQRKVDMLVELDKFYGNVDADKLRDCPRLKGLVQGKSHPYAWWRGKVSEYPLLRPLALRVFSLAASSAASERAFSGEGFIHNKLRNRLKSETVTKLHFIRSNACVLDQFETEVADDGELSDGVAEEMVEQDVIELDDSDVELVEKNGI
jgi:hypothetical protein